MCRMLHINAWQTCYNGSMVWNFVGVKYRACWISVYFRWSFTDCCLYKFFANSSVHKRPSELKQANIVPNYFFLGSAKIFWKISVKVIIHNKFSPSTHLAISYKNNYNRKREYYENHRKKLYAECYIQYIDFSCDSHHILGFLFLLFLNTHLNAYYIYCRCSSDLKFCRGVVWKDFLNHKIPQNKEITQNSHCSYPDKCFICKDFSLLKLAKDFTFCSLSNEYWKYISWNNRW